MKLIRIIGLISLIGLIFSSVAFAEDVCFSEADAKQITVDLEKAKNLKEQVELYKQGNAELETQVKLLKETNKLKEEQITIGDRTIKQYQELIKFQKETYEQAVKDSRPNIFKQIIDALGFIGVGVVIGLIAL